METLKTCPNCNNFYKIDSPQFLINIAISEKIEEEPNLKDTLSIIQNEINEVSNIKWCICKDSLEDKKKYIDNFEEKLLHRDNEEVSLDLGLDFTLNTNIIYYKEKSENSFDKIAFISFLKDIKEKLYNNELDISFNYLNCPILSELTKKDISDYIMNYNYLLIYELSHFLDNGKDLKIFNELLTQRLIAGKKTFILCDSHETLGQLFKEIDNHLYKNQKYILEETQKLLSPNQGFSSRRITALKNKKSNSVIVQTTSPRGK